MTLELDDEELTDVREALRQHLKGLVNELAHADRRRALVTLRERLIRLEDLYARLECAPVSGASFSATY